MNGRVISACMATFLVAAVCVDAWAAEAERSVPKRPKVEVVFVLDTTGSMGGLIHAAKEKVWAIANTLASADPAPVIRMGLVAYRDRGDQYVTKVTNLSDDLDAVYRDLMEFQAQGGGDGPESVNQGLHEAVTKIKWSTDDSVYRVVFLVGDCPPHMDYQDDVKYPETCRAAAAAGIVINTIQCGNNAGTQKPWQDITDRSEGEYFRVEQSGGAILASTPFDAELAELSKALDETRIYYGAKEERERGMARAGTALAIADEATVEARARRAGFMVSKAGAAGLSAGSELVSDVAEGKIKLDELAADKLPEPLQGMSPAERQTFVAKKNAERAGLQAKIKGLSQKRQKHIEAKMKESGLQKEGSLDHAIFTCIKAQAAKKGISYTGGPAL